MDISDLVLNVRPHPERAGAYQGTNYRKDKSGAYQRTTIEVNPRELVRIAVLRDSRGGPVYAYRPNQQRRAQHE